jgi:LPS sulfotransferase NodH
MSGPSRPLRPVFIVGCGRSGTTILYQLLAGHPDLGWFSNNEDRNPRCERLALANNLYKTPLLTYCRRMKYFPQPSEGGQIWDALEPRNAGTAGPPLGPQHATTVDRNAVYARVRGTMQKMAAPRFINKNTRNARRMGYLVALFPDALFIHIVRDGRDVACSLLRARWWSGLNLWWADGKTPEQLVVEGTSQLLTALRTWCHEVSQVRQDVSLMPQRQFLEVSYEGLIGSPDETLARILDFCGLERNHAMQRHVGRFEIRRSDRTAEHAAAGTEAALDRRVADLLRELGYR